MKPYLIGQSGQWGGIANDNRQFINGVFWILRTGVPWRDLSPCYGKWGTVYQRFRRWRDKRYWKKLLEILIDEPNFEWLIIDVSHCKVHSHDAGAKGGNQDMSKTKGGSIPKFTLPWMHMVCRSEQLLHKVLELIAKKTVHLIEGISAETLLADWGYDTNQFIVYAVSVGMEVVIPLKQNRKKQRDNDRYLYRLRYLIENAFLNLKR